VSDRRIGTAASRTSRHTVARRWRFWTSRRGDKIVADEIRHLPDEDRISVHAQMLIVRQVGLIAARHLVEDIYEVEAHGISHSYRLLFSSEGRKMRVLLALYLLEKKSQKTPRRVIELARARRDDWRRRRVRPA